MLQDLLNQLGAEQADVQALIDARNALAASQDKLASVTQTSNDAVVAAQSDVDAKSQAAQDAAAKIANDQVTEDQLFSAELGPLAAPAAAGNSSDAGSSGS